LIDMSIDSELLNQVLAVAARRGLDQAQLASQAKVRPETISRAKKRGTVDFNTLESLARVVGYELRLQQRDPNTKPASSPLADPRHGLAWSNPNASAESLVCNAIKNGNFHLLLQAAAAHGLAFVRQQFEGIASSLRPHARREIQRKLANIEKGFSRA
jgi:DNA-binding phage protein